MIKKISRNTSCPCGSGKKYKNCCRGKSTIFNTAKNLGSRTATPAWISPLVSTVFKIFGYVIIPLLIIMLLREPNFLNGFIDHLEMGQYLSSVNGIFEGKTPYKDFFTLFGAFQLYAITFFMFLFGKTIAVLKTFFYIGYILSFLAIYILARNVYKNRFFMYFIPLICLVEVSHPFWATSWDYGRMGLGLLIITFLIKFLAKENVKFLLIAGTVSCFALFYSIDVGAFSMISATFFILIWSISQKIKNPIAFIKHLFRNITYYGLGVLLIMLPFFAFLYYRGALSPYLKTTFYIIPKYHMEVWGQSIVQFPWESINSLPQFFLLAKSMIFKMYLPVLLYTLIFIYLILSFFMKKWGKDKMVMLILLVYGVLVYKASFRAISGPQFQVALPPLIILIGLFLERMANSLAAIYKQKEITWTLSKGIPLKAISSVLLILLCFFYFLVSEKRYYGTLHGWIQHQTLKKYISSGYTKPLLISSLNLVRPRIERSGNIMILPQQAGKMEKVVSYLEENTEENEEVFTFPEHGLYNFLADRPAFSRFYIAGFAWTTPEWRSELLNELARKKPKVVVYCTRLSNMAKSINRSKELLPEVSEFIVNNYHVSRKFYDIIIYERN
ncbi:MAG: SEC-C domain-containing protein [Candidatus Omnitrophica bacterium]|nr:SEC-C domain-containing protein [Candidatus Omnitrophota bacterium]